MPRFTRPCCRFCWPLPPSPMRAADPVGPVIAIVSHTVADHAAWRAIHDDVQPMRLVAGMTETTVPRDDGPA